MKVYNKNGGVLERQALAAGYDMVSTKTITLNPHESRLVPTGIHLAIPPNHVGILTHRSSLPSKLNVEVITGVIDEDYRGEIKANVKNYSHYSVALLEKDVRYFQLLITPISHPQLIATETVSGLGETHRGSGSFGSTDE